MISSSCADKDDMVLDGDGSKSGLESNNSCFWLGGRSEREKFLSGAIESIFIKEVSVLMVS